MFIECIIAQLSVKARTVVLPSIVFVTPPLSYNTQKVLPKTHFVAHKLLLNVIFAAGRVQTTWENFMKLGC